MLTKEQIEYIHKEIRFYLHHKDDKYDDEYNNIINFINQFENTLSQQEKDDILEFATKFCCNKEVAEIEIDQITYAYKYSMVKKDLHYCENLTKRLLDIGANPDSSLTIALTRNCFSLVNVFAEYGADLQTSLAALPNDVYVSLDVNKLSTALSRHNHIKSSMAHILRYASKTEITECLNNHPGIIDAKHKHNESCLHIATLASNLAGVEVIIEHLINRNISLSEIVEMFNNKNACNESPLDIAKYKNFKEIYGLFNKYVNFDRLHKYASSYEYEYCLSLLKEYPELINFQLKNSPSILHLICKRRWFDVDRLSVIKNLVELGADVNLRDCSGYTILEHISHRWENKAVKLKLLKFLLDSGFNYWHSTNSEAKSPIVCLSARIESINFFTPQRSDSNIYKQFFVELKELYSRRMLVHLFDLNHKSKFKNSLIGYEGFGFHNTPMQVFVMLAKKFKNILPDCLPEIDRGVMGTITEQIYNGIADIKTHRLSDTLYYNNTFAKCVDDKIPAFICCALHGTTVEIEGSHAITIVIAINPNSDVFSIYHINTGYSYLGARNNCGVLCLQQYKIGFDFENFLNKLEKCEDVTELGRICLKRSAPNLPREHIKITQQYGTCSMASLYGMFYALSMHTLKFNGIICEDAKKLAEKITESFKAYAQYKYLLSYVKNEDNLMLKDYSLIYKGIAQLNKSEDIKVKSLARDINHRLPEPFMMLYPDWCKYKPKKKLSYTSQKLFTNQSKANKKTANFLF
jgi:hypothetical protein